MSPDSHRRPVSLQGEDEGQRATPQVWIVDDSPVQRELCSRVLSAQYAVRAFAGGGETLEALTNLPAPHVLVLDWHMPDMSGLDVCRFLRKTWDMAQLPVLVVTTSPSRDSVLDALAAGANDFVSRPVVEAELIARVASLAKTAILHARLEETERRLRVEAEFRERFMGMLAHDLRQPLNAMLLANTLLSSPEVNGQTQRTYLALQQRAGGRMRRMIADLLDFTRSSPERGMPIQRQAADLGLVVRTCLEELRLAGTEQRVELNISGPCSGSWDPDRLAQVCSNLFMNALEHAPPATPIQVTLLGGPTEVQLRVTNQGPEIPEHVIETLFEPFRRGQLVKRVTGGVGLGLHIVQQIVRSHDGTVRAWSTEGRTHFEVLLPRQDAAEQQPISSTSGV